MTPYPNIYGVIPSPATVTVLTGRGTVLENCTHGIPVVNPKADGVPLLIIVELGQDHPSHISRGVGFESETCILVWEYEDLGPRDE